MFIVRSQRVAWEKLCINYKIWTSSRNFQKFWPTAFCRIMLGLQAQSNFGGTAKTSPRRFYLLQLYGTNVTDISVASVPIIFYIFSLIHLRTTTSWINLPFVFYPMTWYKIIFITCMRFCTLYNIKRIKLETENFKSICTLSTRHTCTMHI